MSENGSIMLKLKEFMRCIRNYIKKGESQSDCVSTRELGEFEDEIREIIEKRKTVFCPIINSMCRIDCEAFEMPSVKVVREAPPAHSYISGGECTHFLLRKHDRVEMDYVW